jgi:cytosine/adenosine deaminase-related metal-dependent hydrolase
MRDSVRNLRVEPGARLALAGARCALGPEAGVFASVEIESGRIARISRESDVIASESIEDDTIDLTGYFLLPGFINAHDHLSFALYPRLAYGPYRNYVEWGEDVHKKFADVIARHHAVPKNIRLLWGGIRTLLCGVTTVSHHDAPAPELGRNDFPVRVAGKCGWTHSLALGEDPLGARAMTPQHGAFIVHAGEGVDDFAREELRRLDELGVIDGSTVIVHGLAFDEESAELMNQRGAGLIVCPSSNEFLFGRIPNMELIDRIHRVALGSDSPLTAIGDLLDEIRFAVNRCGISPAHAYHMATRSAAEILQLREGEGTICESGVGDVIAVADTGANACERMQSIRWEDIELVIVAGSVQLASTAMIERIPQSFTDGLEALEVDGCVRWVRAPVREMLDWAETVLGEGNVRLGGKAIRAAKYVEALNVA